MKGLFFGMILAVAMFLSSCSSRNDQTAREAADSVDDGIRLTKQQIENAKIRFGEISLQTLSFDIHAKGKIVLPPQQIVYVSTPMPGTIESLLVREGSYVKSGDPLLTISSAALIGLQEEYATTLARHGAVEQEYQRLKELAGDKIASEKQLLEAKASFEESRARLNSLQMQLELMNIRLSDVAEGKMQRSTSLRAPASGYIERCMIHPGQYAESNNPLIQIIDKSRLIVELMVFEKDIKFVSPGQRVTFELVNLGGGEYEAKVVSIGKTLEESARTVRILAEFVNDSQVVLPGMFIAAEIHTDEQQLQAIAEEAVIIDENESYCFYTLSAEGSAEYVFHKLPVKTGFTEDGFIQVELLQPLPGGAKIAVAGSYFIRARGLQDADAGE